MTRADDFLLHLTDSLVESEGLDRLPAGHPLRDLFAGFDEVIVGERSIVLLLRADDRTLEDCRGALDRFEEMRLARRFPTGIESLLVAFVHERPCPPGRLEAVAALKPAVHHNLFVLEARAIGVTERRVVTRAGWLSRAKPSPDSMEAALRRWTPGAAAAPTSADVDRKVLARFETEERFVTELFAVRAWISVALLGMLGAVFAAMSALGESAGQGSGALEGFRSDVYVRFGAKVNALVHAGEVWRLLSCTFVHGNLVHLLFNGYGLWALGPMLERYFGVPRFLILYFAGGMAGSLASLALTPAPSVGASGALFGLCGAVVILALRHGRVVPSRVRARMLSGMVSVLVINLILGAIIPSIDLWAHLGGVLGGAAAALGLSPRDALSGSTTPRGRRVAFALLLAPVGVSLAFALHAFVRLGSDPLDHPTRSVEEPSGTLQIDYPVIFESFPLPKGALLVGPGVQVTFWSERLLDDPSTDLRREIEQEVPRAFRHRLAIVGTGEKRRLGDRVWLPLELSPLTGGGRHPALAGVAEGRIVVLAFVAEGGGSDAYLPLLEKIASSLRRVGP